MTVIAYHHASRTIACDSRLTAGDRKFYGSKYRVLGERVAMFAGDYTEGRTALRHLAANRALPVGLLSETSVLLFNTRTGWLMEYDDYHLPTRVVKSEAWGSGADFAVGALAAGATAAEAVKIACRYSATCGGKIHVFSME